MSKVNISVDTEGPSLSVNINGKTITDVTDISIYKYTDYDDKDRLMVSVSSTTKEDDVVTRTSIFTKGEYEELKASESRLVEFPEFVKSIDKTCDLTKDVKAFFGK